MKRIAAISTLLVALAAAGLAYGAVTIFKTSFTTRGDYRSIDKLPGNRKDCDRTWRGKSSLGVSIEGGKESCGLSTPVEGDSKQPDHIVQAVAEVTKRTDDRVREASYVGVAVRANRDQGYELRVFPKARTWQLLRNGELVTGDRSGEIGGLGEKNRLQISAIDREVVVKVNGKHMGDLTDANAEQVEGRKTGLTYGVRMNSRKAVMRAFFDRVKVQVPNP